MEPYALRELIRKVSVSYPITFLATLFVVVGFLILALAAATTWPINIVLAACGGFALLFGAAIALHAVFLRPELLRSDEYTYRHRLLDIVGDSDVDEALRDRIGRVIAPGDERKTYQPRDKRGKLGKQVDEGRDDS